MNLVGINNRAQNKGSNKIVILPGFFIPSRISFKKEQSIQMKHKVIFY
jgi:hypothetical protein